MSTLKKNALWFTLYGILITVAFLYLLFPSDIVKNKLEEAFNSSDFILKSESLKPSLPLGVKFKDITISSASSGNIPFQGELLDLQFNPISLFQKTKSVGLGGRAYGGKFKGHVGLASFSKAYPPKEWDLNLANIDLGKYTFIKNLMGKEITGKANGSLSYQSAGKTGSSSGTIDLTLSKGSYPLLEAFLGMNHIAYDIAEIKARLQNGVLKVERFDVSGPQIKGSFKGEIVLADFFQNSRLNLSGEIELLGQNKAKMKVTVSGTPASPELRYI
jgi:type II secretion system protein N